MYFPTQHTQYTNMQTTVRKMQSNLVITTLINATPRL